MWRPYVSYEVVSLVLMFSLYLRYGNQIFYKMIHDYIESNYNYFGCRVFTVGTWLIREVSTYIIVTIKLVLPRPMLQLHVRNAKYFIRPWF